MFSFLTQQQNKSGAEKVLFCSDLGPDLTKLGLARVEKMLVIEVGCLADYKSDYTKSDSYSISKSCSVPEHTLEQVRTLV